MQTKLSSFLETAAQTFIGYVINLGVQLLIYPMYGAVFTLRQNIEIGLIFLIVSLVRGYCIRRVFNQRVKHEQSR